MADKIAVIKTGGKQYKVKEGQTIKIEKIEGEKDKKIKFETLMTATTDGKEINIGKPSLGAKVEGKIIDQGRNKKVLVVKYKNKTRYLRTKGHRQAFTKVEISGIA
ncbi:50S ribosomal protein L21 [Candidatus Falkowbacteria bacterium RIFOXYB2_FULL_34_18]|uniref:Large ribosomal subunit protein bL21 n=1 Tax=Candidatus Falkowbacteria bacterium RIFOXYD2_FULL_34_120 TaxID=1798007 RepID=A0A1F5TN60_9BACT|nr:MAG: 50S ribosomal protein L21 [Candidatus Falkowbacteria bacterium RIFOXYC12_FULL_34_55]OGF28744.1 MAG: 50S ribosomal protein L21 [Candidatus Falkowbacteria bacterium RIFOXYB2_FULL_34_18]OGF38109.1 MAG: 50S ribosomal protein L21 [Candidatus Falkowbacteria bacterium RIFOXYC2_FULL_34_220]OGF38363.1 MAG: 50S ribosomal protein L21 [Candidatus Falkowbacteria bacterium RIFOXYD12_FULL_34_57]OGF40350.1 MAG: 50S ribosomal protein L21 [Candidatus Falkowbacteria bacterium RIFOXYD2_FULL_34_120]